MTPSEQIAKLVPHIVIDDAARQAAALLRLEPELVARVGCIRFLSPDLFQQLSTGEIDADEAEKLLIVAIKLGNLDRLERIEAIAPDALEGAPTIPIEASGPFLWEIEQRLGLPPIDDDPAWLASPDHHTSQQLAELYFGSRSLTESRRPAPTPGAMSE